MWQHLHTNSTGNSETFDFRINNSTENMYAVTEIHIFLHAKNEKL